MTIGPGVLSAMTRCCDCDMDAVLQARCEVGGEARLASDWDASRYLIYLYRSATDGRYLASNARVAPENGHPCEPSFTDISRYPP
jgi:hypothetical protein